MEGDTGASALRDGGRVGALAGEQPVRLFLSGGGHRASLGAVGAVAALHRAGRWSDVVEVVSVSGGSLTSGAMLALRRDDDSPGDPRPALGRFVAAMERDRMRVLATPRRALLALTLFGLVALLVLAALAVLGVIGSDGWWRSAGVGLVLGLGGPVLVLALGRRLAIAMWADVVTSVTEGRQVALEGSPSTRRHLLCASGLSSGVPYYFWADGEPPRTAWGEPLQAGYSVADAVVASTSLPGLGGVRAPAEFRREVLVDGGVSGLFGEQVESTLRRDPQHTFRGEHLRLAIDGGRHSMSPGRLATLVASMSVTYTVVRWLQVALEATYVNDLDDWQETELVRLCAGPEAGDRPGPRRHGPDGDVAAALTRARGETARLGLWGLEETSVATAVVVGFVATATALAPGMTDDDLAAGLSDAGAALGLGDRLAVRWQALMTVPSDDEVDHR